MLACFRGCKSVALVYCWSHWWYTMKKSHWLPNFPVKLVMYKTDVDTVFVKWLYKKLKAYKIAGKDKQHIQFFVIHSQTSMKWRKFSEAKAFLMSYLSDCVVQQHLKDCILDIWKTNPSEVWWASKKQIGSCKVLSVLQNEWNNLLLSNLSNELM